MKTRILIIGAHQDDIEIMGCQAIVKAKEVDAEVIGIVCSDNGLIRYNEQHKAARMGGFEVHQLYYSTEMLRNPQIETGILNDLIKFYKADFILTHNLMDNHPTHIAVCMRVIKAMRQEDFPPCVLFGCEVWGSLDWLPNRTQLVLDYSEIGVIKSLIGQHQSRITPFRNYTEAAVGRLIANATFCRENKKNEFEMASNVMDMTELVSNHELTPMEFIKQHISMFEQEKLLRIMNFITPQNMEG